MLCGAVLYLGSAEPKISYRESFANFLPLPRLITDGLSSSPAEKDLALVLDTRLNMTQRCTLVVNKAKHL